MSAVIVDDMPCQELIGIHFSKCVISSKTRYDATKEMCKLRFPTNAQHDTDIHQCDEGIEGGKFFIKNWILYHQSDFVSLLSI